MRFLKKLGVVFQPSDKPRLVFLAALMIMAAFMEMLGIGLIMPIINVVANPDVVQASVGYAVVYDFLGATDVESFVLRASGVLIAFLILKNLFLTYVSFTQSHFTAHKEAAVSTALLQSYLYMPYEKLMERNSADLLRNINQETSQLFTNIVNATFSVMAESFVALFLFTLLLVAYPVATMLAAALAVLAGLGLVWMIKKPLARLGEQRIAARGRMLEWATQSLYGLKELVVAGRTDFFVDAFKKRSVEMAGAQGFNEAMARVPPLYIESSAILILLIVVMYFMKAEPNPVQALSLFGLITFRVLPSVNRISVSAARIKFFMPALNAVAADLHFSSASRANATAPMPFEKVLKLEAVRYGYPNASAPVLRGVDLTIEKGQIVSIVGPSGAGKSTLLDIMLGLILPQQGSVSCDGHSVYDNIDGWRGNLSYLPQFVYLINDTIRSNVAFGVEAADIDDAKIREALQKAELWSFVQELPQGLDTPIGDITGKLSGGQRQRIGIARALYHSRKILFLDEATTGLDTETEARVCKTLKSLAPQVTVVSVSHQQALIGIADKVFRIEGGVVAEQE